MEHLKINVAIQLLPTKCSADKIELIDKAIARAERHLGHEDARRDHHVDRRPAAGEHLEPGDRRELVRGRDGGAPAAVRSEAKRRRNPNLCRRRR